MSNVVPARPADHALGAEDALRAALESEREVRWAYLFGSASRAEPFRDLDVAVMLQPGALPGVELGGLVAALQAATRLPVDLVDLSVAPASLRAKVAARGRILVDREPAARAAWEQAGFPAEQFCLLAHGETLVI